MISLALQFMALCLFLAGAISFGVLLKGCYVLRREARRSPRDDSIILLKSAQMPVVSVIAVVQDVSPESRAFVRLLLDLHFSNHEVVLVLDGPSAQEFETWTNEFHLMPTHRATWESTDPLRLVVVKTERTSVAAAYNTGLAKAAGSLIAIFDRESEFIPETLLRIVPPMLQDPEGITAVCGVGPEPASDTWVHRFAAIESLRLHLARCAAFSGWNMLIPVPGCCLLIRKDAIEQAGGFPIASAAQPGFAAALELILHLHAEARAGKAPFRMKLAPEPVSHARPPESTADLRRLIVRDQRLLRAAFRFQRSRAGGMSAIGWGLPALLFMRLIRPLLETALYVLTAIAIAVGVAPIQVGYLLVLCTVGTGIMVSMAAVVLRELSEFRGSSPAQLARLFLSAVPENLFYRQIRNFWLVDGFLK